MTSHPFKVKSSFLCAVLSIIFTLAIVKSGFSADAPTVILVGSNIEPYKEAAEGAKSALQNDHVVVVHVEADLVKLEHTMEKVSLLGPKAIIAIGSEAALAVRIGVLRAPVVYCLVVDHNEWLKQPNSWAV